MASLNPTSCSINEILVEEKPFVRTLTLNRPKQLNAISYDMFPQLLENFLAYEEDPNVKLVVMKGNGKAFSAGGDVASMAREIIKGNWRIGAECFWKELSLNYVMATYKKTQVSIINGLVMGAGAGASVHGRFRVVTENTVFAMPETALGLFPDAGASYFLSRLPRFYGEFVGLTGIRLDGAEMLACGLATHFVHSSKLALLEEDLYKANFDESLSISKIIDRYSEQPVVKEKSTYHQLHIIERCFSCRTVEEILSSLENESSTNNDAWISAAIKSLKKASPTSLKISLRSIREGRLQGISQCLVREYRMLCHVLRGEVSKDFIEGCRAILIDKDKNPKWEPSRLDQVSDSMVDSYFSRVNDEDWEDLAFPTRLKLPALAMSKL